MTSSGRAPSPSGGDDPAIQGVQIPAFWHLLNRGEPMPTGHLDSRAWNAIEELREQGRLTVTDDKRIAGSLGLTVLPTRHRIDVVEGQRFTWCALDAVAILAALSRSGSVTTSPPGAHEALTIQYDHGTVIDAPQESVLLIPGEPTGPVVQTWCPLTNLFPDTDSARSWAHSRRVEDYRLLSVAEAVDEGAPLWIALLGHQGPDDFRGSAPSS